MREPDIASVGDARTRASGRLEESVRERLPEDLIEAIDFHGHLCPGLTIGYRAARIVMERLGVERGTDEEVVGIVETDACGVDAFQVLTGCTLGKGNLIYKDHGKQAFTLARRTDGRGVRFVLSPNAFERDPDNAELRKRVMAGVGTTDECAEYWRTHTDQAIRFLEQSQEQLGAVADVEVEIPSAARIFDSVVCAVCGESVMEPRSRIRGGEPCCIPCATGYSRGWEINE